MKNGQHKVKLDCAVLRSAIVGDLLNASDRTISRDFDGLRQLCARQLKDLDAMKADAARHLTGVTYQQVVRLALETCRPILSAVAYSATKRELAATVKRPTFRIMLEQAYTRLWDADIARPDDAPFSEPMTKAKLRKRFDIGEHAFTAMLAAGDIRKLTRQNFQVRLDRVSQVSGVANPTQSKTQAPLAPTRANSYNPPRNPWK